MKCPQCSTNLAGNARFCPQCGQAVNATMQQPVQSFVPSSTPFVAAQATKSTNKGFLIATVLVVVCAGAFAFGKLRGSVLQASGQNGSGNLVQAPGMVKGGDLVAAPAKTTGGNLTQSPKPLEQRPVEVEDYLKFLKRIEASKQYLIREQTGNALGLMTQVQALRGSIEEDTFNETFKDMNNQMNFNADGWNRLTTEFQTRTPPESCRDLHAKYYDQVGQIQSKIMMVNDAINMVTSNPQDALSRLSQLQGKASVEVDEAIRKADDALAEVCDRFNLRKDFDIRGDSSASLLR